MITSLIFGVLVLILLLSRFSGHPVAHAENAPFEINPEVLRELSEAETKTKNTAAAARIKTNRAYNEAKKYLAQSTVENEGETPQSFEQQLNKIDIAISDALSNDNSGTLKSANKKIEETQHLMHENQNSEKMTASATANKKTSMRYYLEDRTAMYLPNPVYTCDGHGTVVINIRVATSGHITHMQYDKNASTTANQCLIDSALQYAGQAYFTESFVGNTQSGSITYFFPGQD
ncbi:MAG: hypothetical protein ACPG7E_01515 [Marinirhabdus sp.]